MSVVALAMPQNDVENNITRLQNKQQASTAAAAVNKRPTRNTATVGAVIKRTAVASSRAALGEVTNGAVRPQQTNTRANTTKTVSADTTSTMTERQPSNKRKASPNDYDGRTVEQIIIEDSVDAPAVAYSSAATVSANEPFQHSTARRQSTITDFMSKPANSSKPTPQPAASTSSATETDTETVDINLQSEILDEIMQETDGLEDLHDPYVDDYDENISIDSQVKDKNGNLVQINDHQRALLKRQKVRERQPTWMHNDKDPAMIYAPTTLAQLLDIENTSRVMPRNDYMKFIQTELNHAMRAILVDWLIEVAEEYSLSQNTLYLTIAYVDRFLSHIEVQRTKLQLVGMGCCMVASKYWEIYPPSVEDFVYISDATYTRDQVVKMERVLLGTFKFQLTSATPYDFTRFYYKQIRATVEQECMFDYIIEASVTEEVYTHYKPSVISAAAIYYGNLCMLRHQNASVKPTPQQCYSDRLECLTEYTHEDLDDCVSKLYAMHTKISSPATKLKAVREKYKSDKRCNVSTKYQPCDPSKCIRR